MSHDQLIGALLVAMLLAPPTIAMSTMISEVASWFIARRREKHDSTRRRAIIWQAVIEQWRQREADARRYDMGGRL